MKLLFDIGNSTINWAFEEKNVFIDSGKLECKTEILLEWFEQNIQLAHPLSAVLVSCVASDEIETMLQDWVNTHWQLEIWRAVVGSSFNELENSYPEPRQMGVDRWLAMIAARDKYKEALCVVDCGTAITIDVIEMSGKHLGGYIIPGIQLMQHALITNTEKINSTVLNNVSIDYANNTQQAISNGACLATVAMIDRAVETMRKEFNIEPKCIITGGMSKQIKTLLQNTFEYEPNLILRGLSIMFESFQ